MWMLHKSCLKSYAYLILPLLQVKEEVQNTYPQKSNQEKYIQPAILLLNDLNCLQPRKEKTGNHDQ